MMKNFVIYALLALAIGLGVAGLMKSDKVDTTVKAAPGQDVTYQMYFRDSVTIGGSGFNFATTGTAYTLPAAALNSNVITFTPNGASLTVTLPGTSTLQGIVPNIGDTKTIFVRNATTTAGVRVTIAGGTGTTLKRVGTSSPAEILGDTDAANYAMLTFIRRTVNDVDVLFRNAVD